MWTNQKKGLQLKKLFEQNVSLLEAFLEAIPTALISQALIGQYDAFLNPRNFLMINTLTYFSSLISASLGLARCLLIGVAGVIAQKGPFDGLISTPFILAYLGK